ncbi:MAG: GIY-YIG nuclease family protein [Candidatus Paceibacteria bacterium]
MQWYVYIVRCADGTLYTGVTTDLERRMTEHNGLTKTANAKGAKYTKARRPVVLVYQEEVVGRGEAQRREASLRKLTRAEKEKLAKL